MSVPLPAERSSGPEGNERLTTITGALLVLALAAEGVTILRIGQMIWLHVFLGLALSGPLLLKLASTGWRFVHYYAGHPAYRRKGPPPLALRLLAPGVVASTLAVMGTGVWVGLAGRGGRDPALLLHKVSFFAWLALTALHVLGHLPGMAAPLRAEIGGGPRGPRAGRAGALLLAVGAGLALAALAVGAFSSWTASGG